MNHDAPGERPGSFVQQAENQRRHEDANGRDAVSGQKMRGGEQDARRQVGEREDPDLAPPKRPTPPVQQPPAKDDFLDDGVHRHTEQQAERRRSAATEVAAE